jgi:hypothetical protein
VDNIQEQAARARALTWTLPELEGLVFGDLGLSFGMSSDEDWASAYEFILDNLPK